MNDAEVASHGLTQLCAVAEVARRVLIEFDALRGRKTQITFEFQVATISNPALLAIAR